MNSNKYENYRIQVIDSFDEAAKYRSVWNDLVLLSETHTPFLIFEWFESWWQCFASKEKIPFIIFVWQAEELIGIAPLMLVRKNKFGFKINKFEFISMMKYAYSAINLAGHLDFIVKQNHHKTFLQFILKFLKENNKNWDYIRLNPILSTSSTLKTLQDFNTEHKFELNVRRVFYNSKIVFDSSWENYLNKLGKDFVKKIFARENKLKQIGKLEVIYITTPDELEKFYDDIVQIDRLSWKGKKGIPIDDNRYKNFYRVLLNNLSHKGKIYIGVLQIDNKKIAYAIVILYANNAIDIKTGYDPSYRQFGTGNIISFHIIKKMFENGCKEYNLLWGNIKAKSAWRPKIEQYDEVFIFNNRLKSRIINILYHKLLLYRIYRFINYKFTH